MSRSVLVVDDDATILRLMRVRLKQLGFSVAEATSGSDALDFIGDMANHDHGKWVLLLDIVMPHTDGVAVCRILRERGFDGKILAHTGSDSFNTRKLCSQTGFDGFLVKPVDAESLKIAIESLFEDPDDPCLNQEPGSELDWSNDSFESPNAA